MYLAHEGKLLKHDRVHLRRFRKWKKGITQEIQVEVFPIFMYNTIYFGLAIVQSLYYETWQTVLFWDILCYKNFVCMNCETYLALEYAHKPTWPTGFEKSKLHQPNLEKLQFKGSRIEAFLLDFEGKCEKLPKNAPILLPENCNFSR